MSCGFYIYPIPPHPSGEPQWERPADFVPIVRENPYASTPEQEFIKSVLSPKRSKVHTYIYEQIPDSGRGIRNAKNLHP